MRVFVIITILIFTGCSHQSPSDPDFSQHWQGNVNIDYGWRYKLEKKLKQQLAEKGLIETIDKPDIIIYALISTWTQKDGYWWIEKRPAKWSKNTVFIQKNDAIYGKFDFSPAIRRVVWFFGWSEKEPDQMPAAMDEVLKMFKKELYLKFNSSFESALPIKK